MKSLKNTIFESIIFFGVCAVALILYKQGSFPNISEGVTKAIMPISIVLGAGFIFVVLISYLKYREIKYNPKSKEAFEIYDTDERNIYLKDKTNSKVYNIKKSEETSEFKIGTDNSFYASEEKGGMLFKKSILKVINYNEVLKMAK